MDFGSVSWLAVVLGAVTFFVVGAVWYGALFSKPWMRAVGIDPEGPSGNLPLIFGGAFLLELLAAFGLAAAIGPGATVASGAGVGAAVGTLFAATTLGVQYAFERSPAVLWTINCAHAVVGFTAMGAVIGGLQ